MQYAPLESKEGFYDVYYTDAGERIVALEGLDVSDRIGHYPMQEYLTSRVDRIELFYGALLLGVACFLVYSHIVVPLYKKLR